MNFAEIALVADEDRVIHGVGRYFRILNGTGDFDVVAVHRAGQISGKLIAGIGVDLTDPVTGDFFKEIRIRSSVSQTVKILVSYFPSSDSRLTGDIDINGLLSVVSMGGSNRDVRSVALVAANAVEVLPLNSLRLKAAVRFPVDVYLGKDNSVTNLNGYFLPAGSSIVDENTSALWVYSASVGSVSIIEDLR